MSGQTDPVDSLWDFGDPAASEARFRAALAQQTAGSPPAIELQTQIARAQGLQHAFDAAHATLDAVERQLAGREPRLTVRYLLERGRALNSAGAPNDARPLFERAWELAHAADQDALAVDAAHMVAIVAAGDEQQAWNQRALELAEASSDPRARRWRGSLLNNIGWHYHGLGAYQQALAVFEQAMEARAEQGQPAELRIARWCVARTLRSLGRAAEALAIQQALQTELSALGEHDGYVDEELGECLLALGQAEQARPHFRRAHELMAADPWLAEREPERLARMLALADGA